MKRLIIPLCLLAIFLSYSHPVYALKKRVRAAAAVYSSAKLSRGTHSVIVTFYPVRGVAKYDYMLSYATNGTPQGIVGSFIPVATGTDSRDLYFGTCSHGVCTAHYGITGATLTVTATTTGGATYIKRYILKNI